MKGAVHKITNSYGPGDAYKVERANGYKTIGQKVDVATYFKAIREVDKIFRRELLKGEIVTLPLRMGNLRLCIMKKVVIKDSPNHWLTNKSIDWKRTTELWEKEPDLKPKGIVVYSEGSPIPKVKFNTKRSNYSNHTFYQFRINRDILAEAHVLVESGTSGLIYRK